MIARMHIAHSLRYVDKSQTQRALRAYLERHGPSSGGMIAAAIGTRPQHVYKAAERECIGSILVSWPVSCGTWMRLRRIYYLGDSPPQAIQYSLI